jgi:F-type H+-transporting ATPase subunit alpha
MSKSDGKSSTKLSADLENLVKDLDQVMRLSVSQADFLNGVKKTVESKREIKDEKKIITLVDTLASRTRDIQTRVRFHDVGTVQHIGNGVATVSGLPNVSIDEIVVFPTGVEGMALNLEKKHVDLIMLGSEDDIRGGDLVQATGARLRVPVGSQLLGRVVDPLGNPLDRDEPIEASEYRFFSKIAPDVIKRSPVNEPLYTGTKVIDALFPIGRGQRELIIGDRQTGKTTLAVDTILSQVTSGVRCIYVAIGQKMSSTLSVIETLRKNNALSHTSVILSSPDDQPALRYLAPYTGITMAEYFLDQGLDVLIVFDDLSKHANAYRELSLLLRRPPGREAYPGDIFYIHSRLLERACKLSDDNGGGSITALPIAVTQNGNISSYIPTNLISITDGQLMLETDLFHQGQKPAIDIGRSVSRVGGAAQEPAMRQLVGNLKLELSQYEEVEHFTRFGTEIDSATRMQIEKGKRIMKTLIQKPNQPYSFPMTIAILFALSTGQLDRIPLEQIESYESAMIKYLSTLESKLLNDIAKEARLTETIVEELSAAISKFTDKWVSGQGGTS